MRIVFFILTLFLTCSCSNQIKQQIGWVETSINGHEVKTTPLECPPHYSLTAPKTPEQNQKSKSSNEKHLNPEEKELLDDAAK